MSPAKRYRLDVRRGVIEDTGAHDYWPATTSGPMIAASDYDALLAERDELRSKIAGCDSLKADAERLDWLESQATLHKQPEILYVVDGYMVEIVDDRERTMLAGRGDDLRAAIDKAKGAM